MAKIESSNFKKLLGVWKTQGAVYAEKEILKLSGSDSYELILDGNYILHRADVKIGDEKSSTFEIIALDGSDEKGKMQYYNSKGESGVMTASLTKDRFRITGAQLTFDGTMGDGDTTLVGKWLMQTPDGAWGHFIDLKLTRQI